MSSLLLASSLDLWRASSYAFSLTFFGSFTPDEDNSSFGINVQTFKLACGLVESPLEFVYFSIS
jgi:hypothetical protein